MKHLILKIIVVTGEERQHLFVNIPTDNIEATRDELKAAMQCDKILLAYSTDEEK